MAKQTKTRTKLRVVAGLVVFLLVIFVVSAVVLFTHYTRWAQTPVLDVGESVTLNIEPGTQWGEILAVLEKRDVIDRPFYFDIWARDRGIPARVKAGQIALDGPMTLEQLQEALEKGGVAHDVAITIPEGFTMFHIADRLEAAGLVERQAFLDAARDPEALKSAGINAESFEGFLFPDTYRFQKGTPAATIIARFHNRFKDVWKEVAQEHADSKTSIESTYQFDRVAFVTMASIIEKESGLHSERGKISRVFFNRLDKNMKLQTDPTCVYGAKTYKEVPSPKRCKDKLNRYSTYIIKGLPPGPIANPGREALVAAVSPSKAETKRYLFFVAKRDGSGGHWFSETYAEHKKAIRRFLKKR